MKTKHVPQRTCIACRTTDAKRGFVRVVRTTEGSVEVDPSGRRSGRGAYICQRAECWRQALKKDRLAQALRTTLSSNDRAALERYAEVLESASVA
jgi:predicted RNA-binding protein YlxR (DUF448 family)